MSLRLRTERLRIEPLDEEHLDLVFRLQSDPEVMRYIRAPDTDCGQTRGLIAEGLAYAAAHPGLGIGSVFLREGGQFVGGCALLHTGADAANEVELGYRLHREFWARGYATELARALVGYGLHELRLPRIVAFTTVDNLASMRVLEKAGLRREGMARQYGTDAVVFAIDSA